MSYILFCTHIRFHFKIIKHLVNKIFLEPLLCSGYFECFLFYSCPHRANILLFDSQGWREDIRSRMNECVSSTNTYTLFFLNCKNTELSGVGINGSMKYSLDFTWDFKKKKKKTTQLLPFYVGKNPVLPYYFSPMNLLYCSHKNFISGHQLCGSLPHTTKQRPVTCRNSTQFWHCLPGASIRLQRWRAQSQEKA